MFESIENRAALSAMLNHNRKALRGLYVIAGYEYKNQVSVFVSPLDGCAWYDIPFAFLPYWSEKRKGV